MEWVRVIDNAVDKIKKDGRDPDASEFLDLINSARSCLTDSLITSILSELEL